jgi:hypothetical protein
VIDPDRLLEFENLLKIAPDDLVGEIVGVVPDEFLEIEKGGEGDDRIFGVHEAFREFDWNVSRALSALRRAIGS